MFRQYERVTFSLRNLAELIKITGRDTRVEFSEIEAWIEEFQKDNFSHLEDFKKIVNHLLDELENIKVYAERLEHKDIKELKEFTHVIAHQHLLSLLPKKEADRIKNKLEEIIRYINRELVHEHRKEKRTKKGKSFHGTLRKRMLSSNKLLAREEYNEGTLLEHLEQKKGNNYAQITTSIEYMLTRKEDINEKEFHKIAELILEYMQELKEEIHEETQIEENTEIQEVNLYKDLEEIKKIPNKEVQKIFTEIHKKYGQYLRRDVRNARKMRWRDKLRGGFLKRDTHEESRKQTKEQEKRIVFLKEKLYLDVKKYPLYTELLLADWKLAEEIWDLFKEDFEKSLKLSTLWESIGTFSYLFEQEVTKEQLANIRENVALQFNEKDKSSTSPDFMENSRSFRQQAGQEIAQRERMLKQTSPQNFHSITIIIARIISGSYIGEHLDKVANEGLPRLKRYIPNEKHLAILSSHVEELAKQVSFQSEITIVLIELTQQFEKEYLMSPDNFFKQLREVTVHSTIHDFSIMISRLQTLIPKGVISFSDAIQWFSTTPSSIESKGFGKFLENIFYYLSAIQRSNITIKESWNQIRIFIQKLLDSKIDIKALTLIPWNRVEKYYTNLDAQGLIDYYRDARKDKDLFTVQGLRRKGIYTVHVTNTGFETEENNDDPDLPKNINERPFYFITKNINNQNTRSYQLSASTITEENTELAGYNKDKIGIILDSGYIYESYPHIHNPDWRHSNKGDGWTDTITTQDGKIGYKTSFKRRKDSTMPSREESIFAKYPPPNHQMHDGPIIMYNDLTLRKWTVEGVFYTKGTSQKVILHLKKIVDDYSFKEYINPEWINRSIKFGVPKMIKKVYILYEINKEAQTISVVYTPTEQRLAA